MIKASLYVLFALSLLTAVFQAVAMTSAIRPVEGCSTEPEIDVKHYRIELKIPEQGDQISAKTTLLASSEGGAAEGMTFDFSGFTVDSATVDGKPSQFKREGDRLRVDLSQPCPPSKPCEISISYRGKPQDGLFFLKNRFGDQTVFADNWPNRAHFWFPSNDRPSDKATVEFIVLASSRFKVIANGNLIEETNRQDGTALTHWREDIPIPPYCMVIGVAEFAVLNKGVWGGTPVSYYLYPKDRENGIKAFGRAPKIVEFYSKLIGPYPYEKLALVQSTTRFGGMENSSAVFFSENPFAAPAGNETEGRLESTVAHEIAHQWFGDSVTECEWSDLWLSEGFASYFGHLFFERADGPKRLQQLMIEDRRLVFEEDAKSPEPINNPAITDLFKLLNVYNYRKGAWTLHMLRRIMGDRPFFAGIRDYYRIFRDGNATTGDFQRVMEAQAGQPLGWFFRQWVYKAGHPVFKTNWSWDEKAKLVRVSMSQMQEGEPFRLPIDIEIVSGGVAQKHVCEITSRGQSFTFRANRRPKSVAFDPDGWALAEFSAEEK